MLRYTRFILPLAIGAAATSPAAAQVAPAPIAPAPIASEIVPAVVTVDAPPAPIAGVAATFVTPTRDSAGGYVTLNRDLSAEESVWHARVALNVAALACHDDKGETVAAYNAILDSAKATLAAAQTGMTARYKAKYGADWQARQDDRMTKLYNFFAQTVAHDGFCAVARDVLRESATVEPSAFVAFATAALPRLEAPFLAFFQRYDSYRVALATWQARTAPRMVMAIASTPAIAGTQARAPAPAPAPSPEPTHHVGPGEP